MTARVINNFQLLNLTVSLGRLVPLLEKPFGEEVFLNIQPKCFLAQMKDFSSCPIACLLEEETYTHLTWTSFQAVVKNLLRTNKTKQIVPTHVWKQKLPNSYWNSSMIMSSKNVSGFHRSPSSVKLKFELQHILLKSKTHRGKGC